MRARERFKILLIVIVLVLGWRIAGQTYRWFAFGEERAGIETLMVDLRDTGLEVVRSQLAADSLRGTIEIMDDGLENSRRRIDGYGSRAVEGALPVGAYNAYIGDLDAYNRRVADRNEQYDAWREYIRRNHEAVARYNSLADSIRMLAAAMGEPFYPLPTPAEIATENGITPGLGP